MRTSASDRLDAMRPGTRRVQICPSCYARESDDAKFCGLCGKALVDVQASTNTLIGRTLEGKYVIRELLARGGMGEVYLGEHVGLRQKVAVKILNRRYRGDETVIKRFFNEAATYCRVSHPNAVKLHDFGQLDDDTLYMIMEFVPGETLTRHLARHGPLGSRRTINYGVQLADVLLAAHTQGVVHRDLKPDNIMLVEVSPRRHQLKVLDFGIAKLVDDTNAEQLTDANLIFGTPEFMSPEQAQGFDVDHRTDIYAFGMLLYYMLTANLPFHGGAKLSILNRQVHEAPKRPSELVPQAEIDPALEALVMRCIAKDRNARYPDFTAILDALESPDEPRRKSPTHPGKQAPRAGEVHKESTNVFDSAPLIKLTRDETVRAADPLQAMFDRAPARETAGSAHSAETRVASKAPAAGSAHSAETRVAGGARHAAETRVAGGGRAHVDTTRRVAQLADREPRPDDGVWEMGHSVGDSAPHVMGTAPQISKSAPHILGGAPRVSPSAPRLLGSAQVADSGPFVITPDHGASDDIPIVIADAGSPGAPVDEDVITGEQTVLDLTDDDLSFDDEPDVAPARAQRASVEALSLREAAAVAARRPEPTFGDGPADEPDAFILGDASLVSEEDLALAERPGRRSSAGPIIGLIVMLLAVGGAAVWFFVLRDAGTDAGASESTVTTTTDDPGETAAPTTDPTQPTDGPTDPVAPTDQALPPIPPPAALTSVVRELGVVRALEGRITTALDEGRFDDAESLLSHIERRHKDALDPEHGETVRALGTRLESAQGIYKSAKKDAGRNRCSRAEDALAQLQPLSAGAAADLQERIDRCKRSLAAPPSRVE